MKADEGDFWTGLTRLTGLGREDLSGERKADQRREIYGLFTISAQRNKMSDIPAPACPIEHCNCSPMYR
jgi:hypothetical protein